MKINKYLKLVLAVSVCQLAGVIGSVFTVSSIENWYSALVKPGFSPPNWLFAPAWISLYCLMGIALFLVWQKLAENPAENKQVKKAAIIFFAQLGLNALWSIIFFGFKAPFYAFLEIILLWFLIALTSFKFYKISKPAGLLILPYLLWVSFAGLLNYFIWYLNF